MQKLGLQHMPNPSMISALKRCSPLAFALLISGALSTNAKPAFAQADSPSVSPVEIPDNEEIAPAPTARPVTAHKVDLAPLIAALESNRATLSAESLPNPSATKQRLEHAISAVDGYLSQSDQANRSNWLNFLQVERLKTEIAKDAPSISELVQIEKNTRQNYPGLESLALVEFRNSLVAHIDAIRFGGDPQGTLQGLDERLKALKVELQDKGSSLSELELSRNLGLILNYLNSANQAPELQRLLVSKFASPSARVLVSSEFLQRAFARPVNQTNPVNEMILGTHICGTSIINGQVTPLLVTNNHSATLKLQLLGQFSSNNVGFNRGVRLSTTSHAGVSACETVQLTDHGLITLDDTGINTSFVSHINSIDHNLKLVRRIAQKKAAEQKPQADAIGKSRLESRISNQFHQQLTEQLSQSNARLTPSSFPVLTRLGVNRPQRKSWSSDSYLALLWNAREADQLAAPGSCPLVVPTEGLTAQIHQSLVTNYLNPVLSGRVIRSRDLDKFAEQFGAGIGDDLAKEATGEEWSITLASYHPVEIEFVDNLVSFQIRTTRLDRGDQALAQPATIYATYRIEVMDGYIQLYRQGNVEIQFAGRAQRGIRAATLRGFLKSKFDTAFKETLFKKPVRPTDRIPQEAPQIKVTDMNTSDGWLQATLK
jgi:hypothetical protein